MERGDLDPLVEISLKVEEIFAGLPKCWECNQPMPLPDYKCSPACELLKAARIEALERRRTNK